MVKDITGKHLGYYEAVLQLREVPEEAYEVAHLEIAQEGIYVAKEKKLENGYDLYLADAKFTQKLARKLQQQFGGEVKITASLFSKRKDKDLYRLTVLLRGIPFKRGDLVIYEGEEYRVKIIARNEIMLQNIKTGEKVHVKYKDQEQIKKEK